MGKGKTRGSPPPASRIHRWKTLNEFTKDGLAGLTDKTGSPAAGLVWYVLFTWASAKDGTVRGASISRLARTTGLAENTVRSALRALEESGALTVDRERKRGRGPVPVILLRHAAGDGAEGASKEMLNG